MKYQIKNGDNINQKQDRLVYIVIAKQ